MKSLFVKIWIFFTVFIILGRIIVPWIVSSTFIPFVVMVLVVSIYYFLLILCSWIVGCELYIFIRKMIDNE